MQVWIVPTTPRSNPDASQQYSPFTAKITQKLRSLLVLSCWSMTKSFVELKRWVYIYILKAAVNTFSYPSSCWSYLLYPLFKVTALFVQPCGNVICPADTVKSLRWSHGQAPVLCPLVSFLTYFTFRLDNRNQVFGLCRDGHLHNPARRFYNLYKLAKISCKLHQQNCSALLNNLNIQRKQKIFTMHFSYISAFVFGLFTTRQG